MTFELKFKYSEKDFDFDFHTHVLPSVITFDCPKNPAKNICPDYLAQNFFFEFAPLSSLCDSIRKKYINNGTDA